MEKEQEPKARFNPWTAEFKRKKVRFNWNKLTEEEKIEKCVLEIYRYNPVWESYGDETKQEFIAEWVKWYKRRPYELPETVKQATYKMTLPAYIRRARWESVQRISIPKNAVIRQISTRRG